MYLFHMMACRANAFDDIIGGLHRIAIRQVNPRERDIFETESGVASLTIEMHMHVIINRVVVTVTHLITCTAGVVNDMH